MNTITRAAVMEGLSADSVENLVSETIKTVVVSAVLVLVVINQAAATVVEFTITKTRFDRSGYGIGENHNSQGLDWYSN